MTFTLAGRMQTRLFLVLAVGIPWTGLISPVIAAAAGEDVLSTYRLTFLALVLMAALGLIWDCVYYALQQLRWDKDWPSSFALLNVINEAAVTWLGFHLVGRLAGVSAIASPPLLPFMAHFGSIWLLMWLAAQGPMRILFLRWRFQGGRLSATSSRPLSLSAEPRSRSGRG